VNHLPDPVLGSRDKHGDRRKRVPNRRGVHAQGTPPLCDRLLAIATASRTSPLQPADLFGPLTDGPEMVVECPDQMRPDPRAEDLPKKVRGLSTTRHRPRRHRDIPLYDGSDGIIGVGRGGPGLGLEMATTEQPCTPASPSAVTVERHWRRVEPSVPRAVLRLVLHPRLPGLDLRRGVGPVFPQRSWSLPVWPLSPCWPRPSGTS